MRSREALAAILGFVAAEVAGAWLGTSAVLAAAAQAVIAEWTAGFAGLRWTLAPRGPGTAALPRGARLGAIARGAAVGGGAAAALLALTLVTREASVAVSARTLGSLPYAAMLAIAIAVRDELLLHGALARVIGRRPVGSAAACAAASACAAWGRGATTPGELASAAAAGALAGVLWAKEGAALAPVAASATLGLATSAVFRGAGLDVTSAFAGGVERAPAAIIAVVGVASLCMRARVAAPTDV